MDATKLPFGESQSDANTPERLCKHYDREAARLQLTPRPPSLIFNTERELIAHFDSEMAKKGLRRKPSLLNFGILLPTGREMVYFIPEIVSRDQQPDPRTGARIRGDEDTVGLIADPNSIPKAYVQLNHKSSRFRDEDRECGGRHYFMTTAQAMCFVQGRE